MENITNMGSCYTNNFSQAMLDLWLCLLAKLKKIIIIHGYAFDTETRVIYNSYTPKFDICLRMIQLMWVLLIIQVILVKHTKEETRTSILAVDMLKKEDVKVFNMGVDYDKYDNEYWRKLEKTTKII